VSPGCSSHRPRCLCWLPLACHVEPPVPSGRHACPRGTSAPPVDLSPAARLLSLSLPLFYRVMLPYKALPEPFPSRCFPFFFLVTTKPTTEPLAEILCGCSTPPKSQRPGASSPPPPAFRPALVEHLTSLGRNRHDPAPLLAGGARGPPHHRRPPSALPLAKLGTGITPPHLHGAYACLVHPRSPAPRREREHAAMAAATPRRRPCSTTVPQAHHPPTGTTCPIGHAGPVLPRQKPRRRRERAGQTGQSPSRAGKGTSAISFPVLRAFVQKPEDLSVNPFFIFSLQISQLLKLIGICRKLQKLSN
jgi:hypothetical protein